MTGSKSRLGEREQIPARRRDEPIREEVPIADDDRQSRFRHRPVIHLRANTPKVVGVLRHDQLTINRLFFRRAGRSTGDVPVRLIRGARHERRRLQHRGLQRSRFDGGNRVRAAVEGHDDDGVQAGALNAAAASSAMVSFPASG